MALEIEEWLTEYDNDWKWALITDVIEQAVTQGYSQAYTADALREAGFTFGNTPFSQVFQTVRDSQVSFQYPTLLDGSQIPDTNRMKIDDTLNDGQFKYIFEYTYFDEITNEVYSDRRAHITDELFTNNELYDNFFEADGITSPPPSSLIIGFSFVGAYRASEL